MNVPPEVTYEDQLAGQLAEIRTVLGASGWETSPPDVFALVNAARDWRDALEQIATILDGQPDEDPDDEPEPFCAGCGASIGIFIGHGDAWLHYRGEGTVASPVELFDAGHEPVVAWCAGGCHACGHPSHRETPMECAACPEGYCERPAGAS